MHLTPRLIVAPQGLIAVPKRQVKAGEGPRWQPLIQGGLVSLQGHGHYCGAVAGSTINAMNTSTNTNQIHHTTTSPARATGIGFLRRNIAGGLLAMAFAATGIGLAATSYADDGAAAPDLAGAVHAGPTCKTEPFGLGWRRTLCDGPMSSDGSWSRERTIWVPAHYSTPICTSRSSSSYSSYSDCYGGYMVNERLLSNETYPVRPDTVLPDEPGHLG